MSYNGTWVVGSQSNPVYGTGQTGFSQDLDQSSATGLGYVSLPTGSFPTGTTLSVAAWIKCTGNGSNPGVIYGVSSSGLSQQLWFGVQGGVIKVAGNGISSFSGSVTVTDGVWHYICVTVSAGSLKLYVDGTQDGSTATGYTGATATSVAIGDLPVGGTFYYQGQIDDVAIYNAVISPTRPSAPISNNASNLIALYHLDNNLNDSTVATPSMPGTPTLTATGGTGTYLSLSSTGSSGGTGTLTYQWYVGTTNNPTTLLPSQGNLSFVHHGLQPNTAYYYKVVVTDSASDTATSAVGGPFTTAAAASTVLKLGVIGDSISIITDNAPETSLQYAADLVEQLYFTDARTVLLTNQAVSGKTSNDWNSSGSLLGPAISAFQSAGCTWVHIMLGTNDAKNTGGFTATTQATFKANLQQMILACKAAGMKVILAYSPYIDYGTAGSPWDSTAPTSLQNYQQAIYQLVDNASVFLGDDACYQFFKTHTNELGSSSISGVHPNLTGMQDLGNLHGQGIYRAVYATPLSFNVKGAEGSLV